MTDFVAGDVHIHKDANTTQRTSSAGITVSIDYDGITGNHFITIDTSDNTHVGFYAVGSDYHVRVEGITVDSKTLNGWVGMFSIENRFMRGTDSAALATVCTEARLAELDAGNLPTATDAAVTDLANATDGLGALKALIDTVNTDLGNGTDGLGALKALIDTVNSDLANGTDGLGALKTLIDTVNTDLSNGTDGLGALKTLIDALNDISSANVLTQVNAALDTAISELGVAAPTATPTLRTAAMLVYMAVLQKRDTTATSDEIHNAAGTVIASSSVSDDGVVFTKAKYT